MEPRYTVIIQWSDEDQAYVVSLPEWGCKTHGATYEEAAKHAHEVLELLMEGHDVQTRGTMPQPKLFHYPGADVVNVKRSIPPPANRARCESPPKRSSIDKNQVP